MLSASVFAPEARGIIGTRKRTESLYLSVRMLKFGSGATSGSGARIVPAMTNAEPRGVIGHSCARACDGKLTSPHSIANATPKASGYFDSSEPVAFMPFAPMPLPRATKLWLSLFVRIKKSRCVTERELKMLVTRMVRRLCTGPARSSAVHHDRREECNRASGWHALHDYRDFLPHSKGSLRS